MVVDAINQLTFIIYGNIAKSRALFENLIDKLEIWIKTGNTSSPLLLTDRVEVAISGKSYISW